MAFSKIVLSGSTNGRGIPVTAATGEVGTTIHTAVTGTATQSEIDEVYIYGVNTATATRDLSLNWGATTLVDRIVFRLPANTAGPVLITPGFPLRATLVVTAFGTAANSGISVYGFANRVT